MVIGGKFQIWVYKYGVKLEHTDPSLAQIIQQHLTNIAVLSGVVFG